MSMLFQINPIRKDPEIERLKPLLPTITKEALIAELCQAILNQNHALISYLNEQAPLSIPSDLDKKIADDAFVFPSPQLEKNDKTSSWFPKAGFFGNSAQYVATTIWQSYGIDLETPPKNKWAAQGQLQIFRSMISDSQWLFETALVYFVTMQKTLLAAAGVLACLLGIKKAYSYFQIGIPETLDKNQITNLTSKALNGELKRAIGRAKETQSLITALTPSTFEKQKIAFLVGKPGVGKTQLVESLAIEINEGLAPTLKGKKLFSVNTASLTEFGTFDDAGYSSRLDLILKEIAGYEKDVILFFDEAHNAASRQTGSDSNAGNGALIELLKTKLLERNISAILATTEDEYEKFISPNKAFVERTEHIPMRPLSDEQTKLILKERVQNKQINISSDAIDTIIEIGNKNLKERANPRKAFDILQKAERHVLAWQPSLLREDLETAEIELRTLKANHSSEKSCLSKIKEQTKTVDLLREKIKTQKASLQKIQAIRHMKRKSFEKHCQRVHLLNNSKKQNLALKKDYLFFNEILRPAIDRTFSKEVTEFERKYQETIPIKIDTPLLKHLFPIAKKETTFSTTLRSFFSSLAPLDSRQIFE